MTKRCVTIFMLMFFMMSAIISSAKAAPLTNGPTYHFNLDHVVNNTFNYKVVSIYFVYDDHHYRLLDLNGFVRPIADFSQDHHFKYDKCTEQFGINCGISGSSKIPGTNQEGFIPSSISCQYIPTTPGDHYINLYVLKTWQGSGFTPIVVCEVKS